MGGGRGGLHSGSQKAPNAPNARPWMGLPLSLEFRKVVPACGFSAFTLVI